MIDRYLFRQITVLVVVVGAAVIAALLLTGCGSTEPAPTEGYVRAKDFTPAHWEGGWDTVTEEECGFGTYTDMWGDTQTGWHCEDETRWVWDDHDTWVEDRWRLKLENCDDDPKDCRSGWVTVDQITYHRYGIDKHYPTPR